MKRQTQSTIDLRLERGPDLDARRRTCATPSLLFPLERSVLTIANAGARAERIDRASFALVPAGTSHRVRAESALFTLVTLGLTSSARDRAAREYRGNMDATHFDALVAVPRILPRTRWVDELVQRYLFERDVCEKHTSAAAVFLETEITKEIYFLCKERDEKRTRASVVHEEGDVVQRARAWIEENLSAPLRVSDLARHCGTSESTLLRAFQRELGSSPAGYARERRLDAALLLLKSGRYAVGEVASRVGYSNLAAFTSAFHRHFGAPPSHVKEDARDAERGLEVLPPHGAPPRRKRRNV